MKITKRQLKRIIREEKQKLTKRKLIKESVEENPQLMDLWNQILHEFEAQFPGIDSSYYGDKILDAMEQEYAAAAADSNSRNQSDF